MRPPGGACEEAASSACAVEHGSANESGGDESDLDDGDESDDSCSDMSASLAMVAPAEQSISIERRPVAPLAPSYSVARETAPAGTTEDGADATMAGDHTAAPLNHPEGLVGITEGRLSAEQMQIEMLVAMGATPIHAGAARTALQLASYAPLERTAISCAWT